MLKILAILLIANTAMAETLDSIIDKAAMTYGVKVERLKMIAQVESSYRLDVATRHNKNGTSDHGPFQINTIIWQHDCKEFNIEILQDHAYCAAKLIKTHRRHKDNDSMWLARYHSKTPKYKKKYYKKLQKAKVLLATAE